ncbi:hypothetical protein GCM10009733_011250 [Nonomuraea maheshkhaliensis]|uniref:Uncharacterized protein n=1 Tax=Nonomuraea maheshkhaliensis TaxID=419590 RepID=A0ABN2ESU3_9ACTN
MRRRLDEHLAGVRPRVARLLEITGADRAVTVHDHVEQALAAVERYDRAEPAWPLPQVRGRGAVRRSLRCR